MTNEKLIYEFKKYLDLKLELYPIFMFGERSSDKSIFKSDWSFDNWLKCREGKWESGNYNCDGKRRYKHFVEQKANNPNIYHKKYKVKNPIDYHYEYSIYRGEPYNFKLIQ